MNAFFHQIFGFVCAQPPAHTWAPGGELLLVCQRCTGLCVGAAIAFLLLLWFRPPTNARYRWLHAIFLLLMTPFGFHLVPHGGVLRTVSGYLFGFGVVGLIWLLPGAKPSAKPSRMASNFKHYLLMCVMGAILLPFFAVFGGVFAALILTWLTLAGMAAVAGLLVGNVFVLGSSIIGRLQRWAVSGKQ